MDNNNQEIPGKYKKLFLYINSDLEYREITTQKYAEVLREFQGDPLLEDIQNFHLLREAFLNLRKLTSKLEDSLRSKVNKLLNKNANEKRKRRS
jgi:hypothetical protein